MPSALLELRKRDNPVMGKLQKSTKKFAASGRLKKVIKARHAQQKRHKNRPVRRRDNTRDGVERHGEEEIAPRRKQTEEHSEDDDINMESDLEDGSEIAGDDESLASDDDLKGRYPLSLPYLYTPSLNL